MELVSRIELPTSSLPMKCTTSVLHQHIFDTDDIIPKNIRFVKSLMKNYQSVGIGRKYAFSEK